MSMVTEILNPFIKTRNQIKKNGKWVDQSLDKETQNHVQTFRKKLTSGNTWTIIPYWIGKNMIVDHIEVGTTSANLTIACIVGTGASDYKNNLFHVIYPDGTRAPASALPLLNWGHPFLECKRFTEVDSDTFKGYKFYLKQPIHAPQGCKIVFGVLGDGKEVDFTYSIQYRELIKND